MILFLFVFPLSFFVHCLNLFYNGRIQYKAKKQEGKHVPERLPACASFMYRLLSQGLRFGSSLPHSSSCPFLEPIV